jgi:cyanophycin synthetase
MDTAVFEHPERRQSVFTGNGLRVQECRVFRGRSLYGRVPLVRLRLDLGQWETWPSNAIPGFVARLLEQMPTLDSHGCSLGHPGGFVRRLYEGTWLGHVIEHVALELQSLAGASVTRGLTRSVGTSGVYDVLYAYEDEKVGLLAGREALRLVGELLPPFLSAPAGYDVICEMDAVLGQAAPIPRVVERLAELLQRSALGPSTAAIAAEARGRGHPVERLDNNSLIRIGYGKYARRCRAALTDRCGYIAVETASDKAMTKSLLAEARLPVPEGATVDSLADACRVAQQLGYPVVVKPLDGNQGKGVTLAVGDSSAMVDAFARARRYGAQVIVERQLRGRDYRVLVVGGRVVAVAERSPPFIVGDGSSRVCELIERLNADPRRGVCHERALTKVRVDDGLHRLIEHQGFHLDSIAPAGVQVMLCRTANLSTGGTAVDRTDDIHPQTAAMAVHAARAVGLDIAGIDMVASDIAEPLPADGGIVEVNASPGLRMHLHPSGGQPRNVAAPIVDLLMGPGAGAQLPIFAITGTNGKSTTARMLAHILGVTGHCVGLTSTTGIHVDDELIESGDASGPRSAKALLSDPRIDVAVLETARGGILREGLGFTTCSAAAVLNVEADHLGLAGIETIEQMAELKAVITEAVSPQGFSVVNADQDITATILRRARGEIIPFSLLGDAPPPLLSRHLAAGGRAIVAYRNPAGAGHTIAWHDRGHRTDILDSPRIPATLDGLALFNVANALAAMALALGHGLPTDQVCRALASFRGDYDGNPGRLNVRDVGGARVIVDYAHNPPGLRQLGKLVEALRPRYPRCIGSVSIPGDRRDADIVEMGRLAGSLFDHVVVREEPDRRGRPPGEVCRLLCIGATAARPGRDCTVIPGEMESMEACLSLARPGDLVVLLPTTVEPVWRLVERWQPSWVQPACMA